MQAYYNQTYIHIFAEVAHIEGDWTIVDNFRLFYLGTDIPDAIDNVNDRERALSQRLLTSAPSMACASQLLFAASISCARATAT